MFGAAKSTDFIEKITWGLAIALFTLCIITTLLVGSSGGTESLISE
jgi:preprotein translocase subunit SecG